MSVDEGEEEGEEGEEREEEEEEKEFERSLRRRTKLGVLTKSFGRRKKLVRRGGRIQTKS